MKHAFEPSCCDACPQSAPAPAILAARDRLLVYTRGLLLDPVEELALVQAALQAIPPTADRQQAICCAMDALQKQLAAALPTGPNYSKDVQPPLNRRHMLAEPMERSLLRPLFFRARSRAATKRPGNPVAITQATSQAGHPSDTANTPASHDNA